MSFSLTTASDWADLLSVLKTFAVSTDGWTSVYDDIAGAGGVGAQLGISKGNCFLSIGEQDASQNPISRSDLYNGGTVEDAYLYMVVNHSLNAANEQFWGHPSSIVTAAGDADRIAVNDLAGEGSDFANVWLFSDGSTYVHVVTQQGGDRFTVFGFGVLDKKNMSHPDAAFCYGCDYTWWPDDANPVGSSADWTDPTSGNHKIGILGLQPTAAANAMLMLKDETVDPVLGFTDGDFQTRSLQKLMERGDDIEDHRGSSDEGFMLDYFLCTDNQQTTGGEVLSELGAIVRENSLLTWVGAYPGIRLVNMGNLIPGQSIFRGSEEWVVFPFKRKGTRAAAKGGSSPLPYVNSIEYGLAIKKIT